MKPLSVSILVLFIFFVSPCRAGQMEGNGIIGGNPIVPERDVQYRQATTPAWKTIWDEARRLSRQRRYSESLVRYRDLLAQKEFLEEARWEYARILVRLEKWEPAIVELEHLVAMNPRNRAYRYQLAKASLQGNNVERAVFLYGRLYETEPEGPQAVIALKGLLIGLEKQGLRKMMLPFLEQLSASTPEDLEILKKTALVAEEFGQNDKAVEYYRKALAVNPLDEVSLQRLAELRVGIDSEEITLSRMQRLTKLYPDNLKANEWLAEYYRRKGDDDRELLHLERVVKSDIHDIDRLNRLAELSFGRGRMDKALAYYNRSLRLNPDNPMVLDKKQQIQTMIAEDLLAIVENTDAHLLWEDLAQIGGDRLGIFHRMADLLRERGRLQSLVTVLSIIHDYDRFDERVSLELASLLRSQGRKGELLTLLRELHSLYPDDAEIGRQLQIAERENNS